MFIRYWAAIATAFATAALVDRSSEFLANAGWLGGAVGFDSHQEGVLPVALLAALVAVGLGITVALRAGRGELTRYEEFSAGHRLALAITTLAATFIIITLMEAWETQFGGLSAFDPRSVFVEHWPAVFIGYFAVATVASQAINAILRVASAAGKLAAHVLVRFLCVDRRGRTAAVHSDDSFGTRTAHRPLVVELGALALRAPPPVQLLLPQQLLT